jgi:hypothetical protein
MIEKKLRKVMEIESVDIGKCLYIDFDKRIKNKIKNIECFVLHNGFNKDYNDFLLKSKFDAPFNKNTKSRTISNIDYTLSEVLSDIANFFDYILISKKIDIKHLDNFHIETRDNGDRLLKRYQSFSLSEMPYFNLLKQKQELYISDIEYNVENIIGDYEILNIFIFNNKDEWLNIKNIEEDKIYTRHSKVLFKVTTNFQTRYVIFDIINNTIHIEVYSQDRKSYGRMMGKIKKLFNEPYMYEDTICN